MYFFLVSEICFLFACYIDLFLSFSSYLMLHFTSLKKKKTMYFLNKKTYFHFWSNQGLKSGDDVLDEKKA